MDNTKLLNVYKASVLARRFEARVIHMAMAGELPPSLHAGAGQEVCQTAAIAALNPEDYILYGHRNGSSSHVPLRRGNRTSYRTS